MTPVLYPPVMGMFCTGYVLHLIWHAWHRRRVRKFIVRWQVDQLLNKIEWTETAIDRLLLSPQEGAVPHD